MLDPRRLFVTAAAGHNLEKAQHARVEVAVGRIDMLAVAPVNVLEGRYDHLGREWQRGDHGSGRQRAVVVLAGAAGFADTACDG